MGLRPTRGNENHPCCHPRVGGGPGHSQTSWIPAFAGMTSLGVIFGRAVGDEGSRQLPDFTTAEILRFAQNDRPEEFFCYL
jgi:hypothetical protein